MKPAYPTTHTESERTRKQKSSLSHPELIAILDQARDRYLSARIEDRPALTPTSMLGLLHLNEQQVLSQHGYTMADPAVIHWVTGKQIRGSESEIRLAVNLRDLGDSNPELFVWTIVKALIYFAKTEPAASTKLISMMLKGGGHGA